jgi:hypothetical protein
LDNVRPLASKVVGTILSSGVVDIPLVTKEVKLRSPDVAASGWVGVAVDDLALSRLQSGDCFGARNAEVVEVG